MSFFVNNSNSVPFGLSKGVTIEQVHPKSKIFFLSKTVGPTKPTVSEGQYKFVKNINMQ